MTRSLVKTVPLDSWMLFIEHGLTIDQFLSLLKLDSSFESLECDGIATGGGRVRIKDTERFASWLRRRRDPELADLFEAACSQVMLEKQDQAHTANDEWWTSTETGRVRTDQPNVQNLPRRRAQWDPNASQGNPRGGPPKFSPRPNNLPPKRR